MTATHQTMTAEQRKEALEIRRAEKLLAEKQYCSSRFGIPVDDVIGYNSGCCYDKAWVRTRDSADKIAAAVKGRTVNGGMFHGMALGGISSSIDRDVTIFEVIC